MPGPGDIDSLLEVLDPDAWGEFVLGPGGTRAEPVVNGAERVARNLVRFWGEGATMVSLSGDGQAVLLGFIDRKLTAVLALNMRGERIQSVQVIADPFLLGFVAAQLPVLA